MLLDTNILIPIINDEASGLDRNIRELLNGRRSALFFSVASLWEIAIKYRLGKLQLGEIPAKLPAFFSDLNLAMLDVTADHALAEIDPVPDTRDPFNRLLLGVCAVEGMRLVTTDGKLQEHPLGWRALPR